MHWKMKAVAFRLLDALPFGKAAHFALQHRVTKNWPRSEENVRALFGAAEKMVARFEANSSKPRQEAIFLEIGAGRDLTVPLALRALGVSSVITIDIDRLARLDLVNSAAAIIGGIAKEPLPTFGSWESLRDFGVDYRAPYSIDNMHLSPDAFVSNETMEHIPPVALRKIVEKAYTLLPEGGLAIHAIDYSDHYARGGSISRYNFLQFTEEQWRPYNSGFQYVSRLRHSEYLEIFKQAGFNIIADEPYAEAIPDSIMDNLADDFRRFSRDDLSIMRSWIVARK